MKTGRILRAVAARAVSRDAAIREAHPGPDLLLGYSRGEITGDGRESIQEHLALCEVCASAVLDFRAFPEITAPRGEELTDHEIDAEWLKLLGRRKDPRGEETAPRLPRALDKPRIPSWRPAYALAACLLLATVGLTVWNIQLRGRVVDLSQPRVNVFVAEMSPPDTRAARTAVEIASDAKYVRFQLDVLDMDRYPGYRVAITDANGRETLSNSEIRRDSEGFFSLEVATSQLPPGGGAVSVFGVTQTGETLLLRDTFVWKSK